MALGEYEDPGGVIARARARQLFWQAFAEEVPGALESLFDREALTSAIGDPGELLVHVNTWWARYRLDRVPAIFRRETLEAMIAYGMYYHGYLDTQSTYPLSDLFVAPSVVLGAHQRHNPAPVLMHPRGLGEIFDIDDPLDLELRDHYGEPIMGWNPVLETREDVKTRHLATFVQLLESALNVREQEARERGLVKSTLVKRTTEHFRWLVRYQCLGQSYETIARAVRRSRPTVTDGVCSTAALLHITLRDQIRRQRRRRTHARTVEWAPYMQDTG